MVAPDPNNLMQWYFVIFGLDGPYEGGYYFGILTCPETYPKNAPNIKMFTENGIFTKNDKICMSMTDYHPESWNPAWPVSQILVGLISFWMQDEYTAGSVYYSQNK